MTLLLGKLHRDHIYTSWKCSHGFSRFLRRQNPLPALLERVSKGESIQITRHGVPVAVLVPAKPQAEDPREVMEQIRKFRKGNRLGGLSIRKLIEERRRF